MKPTLYAIAFFLCLTFCPGLIGAEASVRPGVDRVGGESGGQPVPIPMAIGGTGGVYLLPEPGELIVDLQKRDRNIRGRRTALRAILVGPDRRVLDEVTIPDDGRPRGSGLGPPQRARLRTRVERRGVYGLNITVSQDRYGESVFWGFSTNCPRYVIETARGHRDERHQEPIVLAGPQGPGEVCFLPRPGPLAIDVEKLPEKVTSLAVYDARGRLVQTLPVGAAGRASGTIPAGRSREAVPWRLHLPVQRATVHIDGLTRWQSDDPYPDLCYWTPDPASFFPFPDFRLLLTPYRRSVWERAGGEGEVIFQVHNNAASRKAVELSIEFPGQPWPVRLSADHVVLDAKQATQVTVRYTSAAAGQTQTCHLRATPADPSGFSTYSTLRVTAGTAPAARPLSLPLVLQPYCHENEQFGYLPRYPTEDQVYFDLRNRPFVRTKKGVRTWREGQWVGLDLRTAVTAAPAGWAGRSFGMPSTKIAFDRDNDLYLVATTGRRAALLHSADGGTTFSAYEIPGCEDRLRSFDIEQFSGHNLPDGPPPILRYSRTAEDPRLRWRKINDLELFLPEKTGGRIRVGDPLLLSGRCIGLAAHSGIPSTVVSRGDKVHVVWAEATEPDADVPGVPTYVVTCDRKGRTVGEPVLVAYGPPPNDIHNTPSITVDSQGYLHVLAGTHGQPFPYVRSKEPNDARGGWTDPVPAGRAARQTYIGLVCGPDDTLHAVFRMWRSGVEPFPASVHGTLAYQRKRPGHPWEKPRVLIVPPFSEYSVYYHRLTIDHTGRLFLSYDYWTTYWFYRNDHWGNRRALLMSPDGGDTWKLVQSADLRPAD